MHARAKLHKVQRYTPRTNVSSFSSEGNRERTRAPLKNPSPPLFGYKWCRATRRARCPRWYIWAYVAAGQLLHACACSTWSMFYPVTLPPALHLVPCMSCAVRCCTLLSGRVLCACKYTRHILRNGPRVSASHFPVSFPAFCFHLDSIVHVLLYNVRTCPAFALGT